MNRLIAKMDDGSVLYDVARHRECIERLAAYEDTGLTPDEIVALQAENERLRNENLLCKNALLEMKARYEKPIDFTTGS